MSDHIDLKLIALNRRIEKNDTRVDWVVRYAEVLENALVKSLPNCISGVPGPIDSPAHTEICQRCAALVELEAFEDTPLPEGGE